MPRSSSYARRSRASPPFDALEANLRDEHLPFIEDASRAHRMRMFELPLAHDLNLAELGDAIDALERDHMAKLRGSRTSDVLEGRHDPDALVREARPEMDEAHPIVTENGNPILDRHAAIGEEGGPFKTADARSASAAPA